MDIVKINNTQIIANTISSRKELRLLFSNVLSKEQLDLAWSKIKKANGISTKVSTGKGSFVSD